MKTYTIKKLYAEPDWANVPTLDIDYRYGDTPADITATAQICYDDEALYIRLSTVEKNVRAVETGPIGMPCEDSCLEFFFCPYERDDRYFNIEYNSNGCRYLGMGVNDVKLLRLIPENDTFAPQITVREDGWEICYTVTYEFIRRIFPDFKAFSGRRMRANCYKCADKSDPPHYIAWNPVGLDPFNFHRPECFGEMIFE